MTDLGNTSHAVRAQRHEPADSLDLFCTPPWAVRAFCKHLDLSVYGQNLNVLDPCCGLGHMAEPMKEYCAQVYASDIHDYGYGQVGDFLAEPCDNLFPGWTPPEPVDVICMNPPFNKAIEFVEVARRLHPNAYVLALLRSSWIESEDQYQRLFKDRETRPHFIYVSSERISMVKGTYDPKAGLATSYSWFVWTPGIPPFDTKTRWIPFGGKYRYFREEDALIGKDLSPAQEEKA